MDNQRIRKRQYYGERAQFPAKPLHKRTQKQKPAFRPAGIVSLNERNSGFMEKLKQEPVKQKKTGTKHNTVRNYPLSVNMPVKRKKIVKKNEEKAPIELSEKEVPEKKNGFVFSIPSIPAAALLMLTLGIFFVIYNQDRDADWINGGLSSVVREDNGSHLNLSLYAGIASPPSVEEMDGEIPLDLNETFEWSNYTVRRGDTISQLALDFSISMDAIIASNNISNARSLREGEILRIPNMDGLPYTVRQGDTLLGISNSMGVPLEAILDANDIQSDIINPGMSMFIPGARMNREDLRMALGEALFIHPLRGARMSSGYGWRNDPFTGERRFHAAIDLAAPQGTPIRAARDGTVSAMGFDRNLGNYIIISHAGGYQTVYAHLHSFSVRRGDTVRQGVQIGTVGSTGRSTGPHLHFAIIRNGRAINPLDFLGSGV